MRAQYLADLNAQYLKIMLTQTVKCIVSVSLVALLHRIHWVTP